MKIAAWKVHNRPFDFITRYHRRLSGHTKRKRLRGVEIDQELKG
jgi:hypothetical protein